MATGARALSDEELDAFLSGPVIARIATVQPGGAPYIAPVWQQWDGGRMYVIPRGGSRFVEHLKCEPRVAVSCADDVDPAHTRVLIEGEAEVVEGPAPMAGRMLEIAREMALRYMGPDGPRYVERTVDRPRYLVRITPGRIVTWTGGEWHPRYLAP